MKKIIAISVMLVMIAGAVFADTSVAGAIETRLDFFRKIGDADPVTQGSIGTAWIQLSGTNEDGTLSGTFRLRGQDIVNGDAAGSFRWHKAFVWWKPIPQMRFFLGQDADGMFETGQLTSWAFHRGSEGFLVIHNWDFWRDRFPGNWDTFGAALSFYLVEGLDLNLVIPIKDQGGWPRHDNGSVSQTTVLKVVYPGRLQLTGGYNIEGVGKIAFAWIGSGEDYSSDTLKNYGKFGLSFFSNSLAEGLSFQVGGATSLGKGSTKNPINVGAAVHFSSGDFGLKFRVGSDIDTSDAKGMLVVGNVMPTYNTSLGSLCLDIGVAMKKASKSADSVLGYWINPYLKKGMSGGYFQVGLIYTTMDGRDNQTGPVKDRKADIYLPMLLGFNF